MCLPTPCPRQLTQSRLVILMLQYEFEPLLGTPLRKQVPRHGFDVVGLGWVVAHTCTVCSRTVGTGQDECMSDDAYTRIPPWPQ